MIRISRRQIPFLATAIVCVLLYVAVGLMYKGFFSIGVLINLLSDNAFLGVVAIGMTFVILSGGIDLSVGSVVGCTSIVIARLIEHANIHPLLAMAIVLLAGLAFGTLMGSLIHFFELPPFLVTLGGLFFCRGIALVTSTESIPIGHPLYVTLSSFAIPLGASAALPLPAVIFLVVLIVAVAISLFMSFGRNVYALGGNEQSAVLMGLSVSRTKIGVYALSGFCSALGGIVYTIYTSSGNAIAATGLELDAIAAVVVGGTLLSGGVGYVAGTLLGLLIFGIIQTAIIFQGTLSSWWTRIAVGVLLLAFILLQKLLQVGRGRSEHA
jgi:ribose/xylose/arabinose/galactoside ABC-type transport system permease subunit